MTGATAGKIGCLRTQEQVLLNQRVAKLQPHSMNKLFFWSVVSSTDYQAHFFNLADGAAQPNMSGRQIEQVLVPCPPPEVQRRIASILSTYDDLIENNTRRIASLGKIARRLYEEWFVHFRFPGHEENRGESALPEEWERLRLEDVASFISRGIAPKYDDNSECRVINQKCIRDQSLNMNLSRRQSKKIPRDKVARFGDVLINSTGVGTLGRVAQVYESLEDVTVDSHVTIARPKETINEDYFGLTLLALQSHFEGQGVGATGQTELSRGRIAATEFIRPPLNLQERFGETVRPMRFLCANLSTKNANLRAQRDLLLPKLISGQIDVSQTEEVIEEAVA